MTSTIRVHFQIYFRRLISAGGFSSIRASVVGVSGLVKLSKLQDMQERLKLHYASVGTHNTMRLDSLEEMTSGEKGREILNDLARKGYEMKAVEEQLNRVRERFSSNMDIVKVYREHSKSIPRRVEKSHKVDEVVRKAEKAIAKRMI